MKAPKKSPTPKQKAAAALHAKALEVAAIAETVRAHNAEAAASHDAAADAAEELRRQTLKILEHTLQLAADQALDIQAAPEPVWSSTDLQNSAIYSGQFIPDGGREIVKEDVPAVKKPFWQKIGEWWDNL